MNTDVIRQTMKNLTVNEDIVTYRNYCDTRLYGTLDEIDRLERELKIKEDYIATLFDECDSCRPKIEHRTKEACKARIISSFAGHDIHSLDPVNITIDEILEAIDSTGGNHE